MGGKERKSKHNPPKGHEFPVSTQEEFEQILDKVAKPVKKSPTRRPKKG